jgi:hypothetical protein
MPTESIRKYLAPFWRATHVTADPVVFIGDEGHDVAAHLLFPPDTVSAVTNAAGDVAYHEGVDYLVQAREGRIVRPVASRMPLTRPGTVGLSEPSQVHERLVTITYTHAAGLWSGYVPAEQSAQLPRTLKRLRSDDAITICVMGDSISEGYDASGFRDVPPHQPPYPALVAAGLRDAPWSPADQDRICRGGVGDQPARCYEHVMRGTVNWGGGTADPATGGRAAGAPGAPAGGGYRADTDAA